MKTVIDLKNIKFASLNDKFHVNKGRLVLTQKYREFKNMIFYSSVKGYIEPPYKMIIYVDMYEDYDNILKPIADGLKIAGVIKDDRFIERVEIYKTHIPRGSFGNLQVDIGTL